MDCIPAGMELFPAADEEQWAFIRKVIDDCDYYILIIGGRYGSTTAEGISYTEKEYDYAVSKGIPVLVFLHGEPSQIPIGKSEIDPKARERLAAFRTKVATGRLVKTWSSSSELPGLVALSLSKASKSHPKPGWVRGGSTSNPELLVQLNDLRNDNEQLKQRLAAALDSVPRRPELNLASADDTFRVHGTFKYSARGYGGRAEYRKANWGGNLSWNQIMALLGPDLFQPINEAAVNVTLANTVCSYLRLRERVSAHIDDETFGTLKVQLVALGYIEVKSLETTGNTMALFWTMTPLGHEVMLQLRTVKSTSATKTT